MKPGGLLPLQVPSPPPYPGSQRSPHLKLVLRILTLSFVALVYFGFTHHYIDVGTTDRSRFQTVTRPDILAHRQSLVDQCRNIHSPAGPSPDFDPATRLDNDGRSERFVEGTKPTLIRNAKIWTGHDDGKEVIRGDVLLDRGLVVDVGKIHDKHLQDLKRLDVIDAKGRWVTPGLVDLHSHIGVDSSPHLDGAADTNSRKAPILPWLRSIDGINTHDRAFELTVSGGVTTVQVLPGSANNIGGQAFIIKLRPTSEKSTISKVLEPPQTLVTPSSNVSHLRWRHMKHACGENIDRVHSQVRMDAAWNFRQAYHTANDIKNAQDAFCDAVEAEEWDAVDGKTLPEDYQWESLVDVLRGKVRLSIHCYEAVDLDMIIRVSTLSHYSSTLAYPPYPSRPQLSNEFKFHVHSFHHGGDTHLVPDLLKKTFGGAPTIALFASNARKKREAYRNSEFAPRILAANNISVVMKSDHPVLNSRYLLYEAQQAHYYGLSTELALASVTTTPAKAAGMSHRVGFLSKGYDADVVIWDSHPLAIGATPAQVIIDGIHQLSSPHVNTKPFLLQRPPKTPNFDKEARETIEYDGLPPLRPHAHRRYVDGEIVKVVNVSTIRTGEEEEVEDAGSKDVYIHNGKIFCTTDTGSPCLSGSSILDVQDIKEVLDLRGGALLPGLTSFGSPLGLEEIAQEPSTNDGSVPDALTGSVPSIIGGTSAVVRAVDGLTFNGRNLLHAYRGGVTRAITPPSGSGFIQGLSTEIFTGAENSLEPRAIIQEEVALHATISHSVDASISTQITALRQLLFESNTTAWQRVRNREIPLVINVDSADIMSTLILLKESYRRSTRSDFDLTFTGAAESHLIAEDIAKAGISVVVTKPRPFPGTWEGQRILPGAPLTHHGTVMKLLDAGVNVGIGIVDGYDVRNTRFEAAWLAVNSFREIGLWTSYKLVSINVQRALGAGSRRRYGVSNITPELVAYEGGGWSDFESKVVGVFSSEGGFTELF
ncbi:hypothetical protein D9756_011347 [Leucocoprinus leucothites]|uniref:Amidohydrolase-related domain-containing protein n=1 Tax=Leucocoprinus leucothites TaxID=201217 RepID=A0A8H5CP00_9AGAR|nr:hypothetical protein D9756_011347 [Leucoagaricus leucothites]